MEVVDISSSDSEDFLQELEDEYNSEITPSNEFIDGPPLVDPTIEVYHSAPTPLDDNTYIDGLSSKDLGKEMITKEHPSRRILPPSILPRIQGGRRILKSNAPMGTEGFVFSSAASDGEDIQFLGSYRKPNSLAGVDMNSSGFHSLSLMEHRRHLPPWMDQELPAGNLAGVSSNCSQPTYPKASMNHLGTGEKKIDPGERLIFQAALQDLNQPKNEGNVPTNLLAVSLLRHQKIALAWMQKKENSSYCSGGILADDQGLGKTVSVLALIQIERQKQEKFSATDSDYVKSNALDLEEVDSTIPEDAKPKGPEDHLSGLQKPLLMSDHSCHVTLKSPNIMKIDDLNGDLTNNDSCKDSSLKAENTRIVTHKGRPAGGTLVVCPASILRQWAHEIEEKVPEEKKLSFLVYHGSSRSRDPSSLAKYDVVLTTYAIVSNEVPKHHMDDESDRRNTEDCALSPEFSSQRKNKRARDEEKRMKGKRKKNCDYIVDQDSGPLARVRWFRVVLDEAQTIKNFRTQVSKACCGLRAKRRWCLSGTPLQNSIDDLYSYFRFLRYDPYAVYGSFCSSIKNPITSNPSAGYQKLQAILRTIMLRRTKGTLIDGEPIINLPPRIINLKKIYFTTEERTFYSNLEADSRQKFKAMAAAGTVNQNYASILLLLLRLRQACDHPLLVKGRVSSFSAKSSLVTARKLPREMLTDLLNRLEGSLAICGVCSDPPEEAVVTMCGHVFCYQCISGYLNGDIDSCPASGCRDVISNDSVFSSSTLRSCLSGELLEQSGVDDPSPNRSVQSSSKIEATMDILRSFCKNPSDSESKAAESEPPIKAIVFSQWTSMLDFLEASLNHSLIQYRRLDGSMSLASRERAVRDFNTDPEVGVMIMSLKAGNLGLNMVAACHVILLDPWWNPTTEDQAIDRAHRIGQLRPVTVSRLSVCDTVEDRILALQEKKREIVSSAFGEDQTVGPSTRLTVEDLRYLFRV
ncbi:helicase-like transcription factor CHR28 isoform X2 [Wolffia australiana]